ncbi:unnamed protein product, partial [marine sediment metagenome]
MGKLSVLLPIYNGMTAYPTGRMVNSISSVLRLECEKEVIVIDDGSIDVTAHYLQHYFGDGITLIKNGANRGQAVSLNKGLEAATGDYI